MPRKSKADRRKAREAKMGKGKVEEKSPESKEGESKDELDDTGLAKDSEQMSSVEKAMESIMVTFAESSKNPASTHSRDISVESLSMSLFGKELIVDADLKLNWGRRYGLIAPNGSGKSLLLHIIGRRKLPFPDGTDVFHVVSEVEASNMTALEAVLSVDKERQALEEEAERVSAELETVADEDKAQQISERVCEIYERLDELDAATAEARAAQILHGLQFSREMMKKKTKDFSGGWRMRISLARALFLNPSLLVLDEPTNHLDMEAVVWLESYLAKFKKILLMVSHSQDFLNNVCTNIILLNNKKLEYYSGNYDTYVSTRNDLEEHQMKRHAWEQDQIKKMKDYIAKFGHGSAKLAKQAQSKEKVLAKMTREGLTSAVRQEKQLTFSFTDPGDIPPPVLQIQALHFSYPNGHVIYDNVDWGVDLDSRIALVGPNGAGKTTLLKLIAGELVPTSGNIKPHPHLRIARYTQHFVDSLDLTLTPLDYFCKLYQDIPKEEMRKNLGRFGITGSHQTEVIADLSDGLKSRVCFALIGLQKPHILCLDEPTNHLDIESIDALADAINQFKGGLLLVSHDMRLISQVAKEIWQCKDQTIVRYEGDIQQYKKELQAMLEEASAKFEEESKTK